MKEVKHLFTTPKDLSINVSFPSMNNNYSANTKTQALVVISSNKVELSFKNIMGF